ncbi:hypothetical protein ABW22_04685 [Thiobacillus denitrificans]|uniref:Uncharacterized protein n=1 Tax=Thiobacillus denitrificans TaxID=36861 RepID=A0A119CWT2_THIDE|nr:hypothetical protein ABW22_04685 [Thiobacillus denitrificans]
MLALTPMQGVLGAGLESGDFEGYPVVSNQELAALRGGFELNIGGQLLSLAFSLEQVSYLNGQLLTSTRIVVPDIAAAILSPQTISVTTDVAAPASGETGGNPANPPPQIASVSVPGQDVGSYVTLIQNGAGNSVAFPAQVSQQVNQQMNQALQAAQAQILQAYNHVTVIQNSLDNQVIQNMTTLNITLSNAALAQAAALNAGLAQVLNMPIVLPH